MGHDNIARPTVEIFKSETLQWYKTNPLPMACRDISLVAMGNTCYALGGFQYKMVAANLNQALYASVDNLICHAVPADQATYSGSSDTIAQSAWKTLPNTPNYQPTAALLAGNLLAIGGNEKSVSGAQKDVYAYSPSTNSWIYLSDLYLLQWFTLQLLLYHQPKS